MTIKKYMSGATFGPETIKDMTTALERIRTVLRLEDPDDPLVEVVAKKVISLASLPAIAVGTAMMASHEASLLETTVS